MSTKLLLLQKYPLLIPNSTFTSWNGILKIMEDDYLVTIHCPAFPYTKYISLDLNERLQKIVEPFYIKYEEIKQCNVKLDKFVDKFVAFLESIISSQNIKSNKTNSHYYKQIYNIYKELEVLEDNILDVSEHLTHVVFIYKDSRDREHELGIKCEFGTNVDIFIEKIDLPEEIISKFAQVPKSITAIFKKFCQEINLLQDFFHVCDLIDRQTTVMEPQSPERKHTYRKIALSECMSVKITLNITDAHSCPDIAVMGEGTSVNHLKTLLETNMNEIGWDDDLNMIENLILLLGIEEFPDLDNIKMASSQAQLGNGECSICLSMRHCTTSEVPAKLCSNNKCCSYYHEICLSKWLESIPSSEIGFGLVSGKCPLCKMNISCRLLDEED